MKAVAAWVPGLGPLESAIMTVIWDAGQSLSVRVVRERMDYQSADGEDPAYTTVMSVMVILWRKGFLDRAKCPGAGPSSMHRSPPRCFGPWHSCRDS